MMATTLDRMLPVFAAVGLRVDRPSIRCFDPSYEDMGTQIFYTGRTLPGILNINRECRFGPCEMHSLAAHELGHAVISQKHYVWRTERGWCDHPEFWSTKILDEGIAEHLRVDMLWRFARKEISINYAMRALKDQAHMHHPLAIRKDSFYREGYLHVMKLRRQGHSLPEIIETPWDFLPTD